MRDLLVLFVHLVVTTVPLMRPGGARAIVAESLLLKQQLLIVTRSRRRAPDLRPLDRVVVGLCAGSNAKARQLRLNSTLPPQQVLSIHAANELSGFVIGRVAACLAGASRPPTPMRLSTDAMPADDGIRLDDDERATPIRKPAASQNPESTVHLANPGTRLAPLENDELLPQTQVLSHQSRLGFDGGGEDAGKETDHLLIAFQLLQSDQRSNTGPTSNAIDG